MAYSGPDPFKPRQGGTGAQTLTGIVTGNGTATMTANTVTQHGVLIGGASNAASSTAALTDGQVVVGLTGSNPIPQSMAWIPVDGGFIFNLGVTLSSGVFTLTGSTASLSSSNPAYAILRDKDSIGRWKNYKIIADQSFNANGSGASQIIGNLWSNTTGVATGNNKTFFIYLVSNDDQDTLQAMISDSPCAKKSVSAANIGAPDDVAALTQGDFWSFSNIDETLYDSNPCVCIGSLRMSKNTSDDWNISTLRASDGIGQYQESASILMYRGQFGAATGSYFSGATTAPTGGWDYQCHYKLDRSGWVDAYYNLNMTNTPSGTGAVSVVLPYLPYQVATEISQAFSNGYWLDASTTKVFRYSISNNTRLIQSFVIDGGTSTIKYDDLATGDAIRFTVRYGAFYDNS